MGPEVFLRGRLRKKVDRCLGQSFQGFIATAGQQKNVGASAAHKVLLHSPLIMIRPACPAHHVVPIHKCDVNIYIYIYDNISCLAIRLH